MTTYTQFSVFLVNRPWVLTQVCRALAEAKVNIVAMTMMDAMEHGVMRLICANADKARDALQRMNFTMTETEVLAVDMPNKPGAAAEVCEKLATGKVAISYMYCSTAGSGKAIGIFKVGSLAKAKKALEAKRKPNRQMKIKRRQPVGRR
jgi:hypothetical protein